MAISDPGRELDERHAQLELDYGDARKEILRQNHMLEAQQHSIQGERSALERQRRDVSMRRRETIEELRDDYAVIDESRNQLELEKRQLADARHNHELAVENLARERHHLAQQRDRLIDQYEEARAAAIAASESEKEAAELALQDAKQAVIKQKTNRKLTEVFH